MSQTLLQQFIAKAEQVSTKVSRVKSMDAALEKVVAICEAKDDCQRLADDNAAGQGKIIAAPALDDDTFAALAARCSTRGFRLIKEGMRDHLGGIDAGFTLCNWGIADTGSLVLDSTSEEVRLATMVSEIHIALLPLSKLVPDALALEDWLTTQMLAGPNYTAFITGASRTADIERVLAIGVHGPLELHVLLLED